jgi:hypothetical protein
LASNFSRQRFICPMSAFNLMQDSLTTLYFCRVKGNESYLFKQMLKYKYTKGTTYNFSNHLFAEKLQKRKFCFV